MITLLLVEPSAVSSNWKVAGTMEIDAALTIAVQEASKTKSPPATAPSRPDGRMGFSTGVVSVSIAIGTLRVV